MEATSYLSDPGKVHLSEAIARNSLKNLLRLFPALNGGKPTLPAAESEPTPGELPHGKEQQETAVGHGACAQRAGKLRLP